MNRVTTAGMKLRARENKGRVNLLDLEMSVAMNLISLCIIQVSTTTSHDFS